MGKTVKEERKEDRRKAVRQREERKENKHRHTWYGGWDTGNEE